MKTICLQLGLVFAVGAAGGAALAIEKSMPLAAVQQAQPGLRLAGHGEMRFFGLRIYDARLWVAPSFEAQAFGNSPLALELTYHRAFTGQAIAERSVQEIERQRPLNAALAQRWTAELLRLLPDVKQGESLTGLYLPGQGMRLWLGDRALGMIEDPELARYFFGIWLSPQTSEPKLRSALLADLGKDAP